MDYTVYIYVYMYIYVYICMYVYMVGMSLYMLRFTALGFVVNIQRA